MALALIGWIVAGCTSTPANAAGKSGPVISAITPSTESFSIDCAPTSVTVTARITDPAGIAVAGLWYRVGSDRNYVSMNMMPTSNRSGYEATVKGSALPPDRYGAMEFYIAAQDWNGHASKSPVNTAVQFLPCVSH